MKRKKTIIDILVITFAFLLFTIWYRGNGNEENAAHTAMSLIKYQKIYLITTNEEYQYWDYVNQGATDMATSVGIDYTSVAPTGRTAAKQVEVINKAVDDGARAILIAADDPKRISSAVEDAKARGVKIIYVDAPANEEAITTLATDNFDAGIIAGQTMLSELEKQGIQKGSIGIFSVASKQNTQLRDAGFRKVIMEDNRFALLDTILTNGEPEATKEAANRLISENKDLVGLLGSNEGTSEGVGNAIKADNNRIIGIGFDKTDEIMKLLKSGSLKAIMVQNPYTMGYLGMAEAIAALMGKDTGPSYINTGITILQNE
jgi:ribose transport system substrate-binding protein